MTTTKTALLGNAVLKGYLVLANYRDMFVLGKSLNHKAPEPFVVWNLDGDCDPYNGSYFVDRLAAEKEFVSRSFPWFVERDEGCEDCRLVRELETYIAEHSVEDRAEEPEWTQGYSRDPNHDPRAPVVKTE